MSKGKKITLQEACDLALKVLKDTENRRKQSIELEYKQNCIDHDEDLNRPMGGSILPKDILVNSWDTMSILKDEDISQYPTERDRQEMCPVIIKDQTIEVEAGIAPIVNFLNSHNSIKTIYSCAGHNAYRVDNILFHQILSNVVFECSDISIIEQIVSIFSYVIVPSISQDIGVPCADLVYIGNNMWQLKFPHIPALDASIVYIMENRVSIK